MLRFDHLALPIWDVEKTIAFYRDVLCLPLVDVYDGDDWGGHAWLMLMFALSDKRELVLVYFAGAKRPSRDKLPNDARHIALAETESLDPWRERLRSTDTTFWEEDHGDQRSVYFEDPNGIVIEITYPPTAPRLMHDLAAARRALKWVNRSAPPKQRRNTKRDDESRISSRCGATIPGTSRVLASVRDSRLRRRKSS